MMSLLWLLLIPYVYPSDHIQPDNITSLSRPTYEQFLYDAQYYVTNFDTTLLDPPAVPNSPPAVPNSPPAVPNSPPTVSKKLNNNREPKTRALSSDKPPLSHPSTSEPDASPTNEYTDSCSYFNKEFYLSPVPKNYPFYPFDINWSTVFLTVGDNNQIIFTYTTSYSSYTPIRPKRLIFQISQQNTIQARLDRNQPYQSLYVPSSKITASTKITNILQPDPFYIRPFPTPDLEVVSSQIFLYGSSDKILSYDNIRKFVFCPFSETSYVWVHAYMRDKSCIKVLLKAVFL